MATFCVNNRLYVHCVFLFVQFILLLTCIYGTIKYFKFQRENKDKRPPKLLSIVGPIHLLISIGALTSALVHYTFEMSTCYEYVNSAFAIYMIFYCLQVYGLWIIYDLTLLFLGITNGILFMVSFPIDLKKSTNLSDLV